MTNMTVKFIFKFVGLIHCVFPLKRWESKKKKHQLSYGWVQAFKCRILQPGLKTGHDLLISHNPTNTGSMIGCSNQWRHKLNVIQTTYSFL